MISEALQKDEEALTEEMLVCARQLVVDIEQGNAEEVKNKLDELTRLREAELFQELGKLTRQLHESLNNFQVDSKIALITEQEIPDAKERLLHVISMTEDAAHKTMNAVDESMPLSASLLSSATEIHEEWKRFRSRELSVEEFRKMSHKLDDFFVSIESSTRQMHDNLNEIMMAQGFQDLTGQIIRRVISLVQDVEDSLVELIRLSGKRIIDTGKVQREETQGFGPEVPGVDHGDTVEGQDEVDELLSSLGF